MHSGCSDADTNMRYITDRMNLRQQADRDKLVQTLTECGWAGGVLCIDTLAHAANGIDENSSEMGEMIAIFRELQHRLGGVILIIHHSGKSQERGMRGWSGLRAGQVCGAGSSMGMTSTPTLSLLLPDSSLKMTPRNGGTSL